MLKDNINITVEIAKNYLRVPTDTTDDDDLIHKMLDAASNRAQRFMNNEFTIGEVPADIEMWILQRVGLYYEKRILGITAQNFSDIGMTFGESEFDDLLPYRVLVGT